jgi:hypothetical protein
VINVVTILRALSVALALQMVLVQHGEALERMADM